MKRKSTTKSKSTLDPAASTDAGINTPDLDPKTGKIRQISIVDADQAYSIAKSFENANRERDGKNGKIAEQYNGKTPVDQPKLVSAGQGWRNNVCTGFFSSIVDRKQPEFVQVIESQMTLTNAQLPEKFRGSDKKSTFFRQKFTEMIRSWEGWRDFLHAASMENVLYGYACVACTDLYNWRPELYTQSNFYVPEDVPQNSSFCQCLTLRKRYMIHEAIKKIADTKNAQLSGWNINNWVYAINNARAVDKAGVADRSRAREYADLARTGTLYESFRTGSKVIEAYEVFGMEANGMVSQYLVGAKDGKEYFKWPYRYRSMTDVCTFLSLQVGNRQLLGSKGLGRLLLNLSIAAERVRNLTLDVCALSQNLIIKVSSKDYQKIKQLQMSVFSPFTIIAIDGDFVEMKIEFDFDKFAALDNRLIFMAETLAGAVLPGGMNPDIAGQEKTATQSQLDAVREQATRAGVMARWAYQVSNFIGMMQRRICNPGTVDPQAREFQRELIKFGFKPEEILAIGNCPPARNLNDLEVTRKAQIEAITLKYGLTPYVNKGKLAEMDIEAMSSPQIKDEIFTGPEELEADEIQAVQKQLFEISAMIDGKDVPVSPHDNHPVHRRVLKANLLEIAPLLGAAPQPELIDGAERGFAHFEEHLQKELMLTGEATAEMKADEQWLNEAREGLKKVVAESKHLLPPSEGELNGLPIPANAVTSMPARV